MFRLENGMTELFQWDLNQKLIVEDKTITQVHFTDGFQENALVVLVKDGLVDIPNILLQSGWNIIAYAFTPDYTKVQEILKVNRRVKPFDYAYTETEILNWAAIDKKVQEAIDTANKASAVANEAKTESGKAITAAEKAETTSTEAKAVADAASKTATEASDKVGGIEKTANDALSLAQTNEHDISMNDKDIVSIKHEIDRLNYTQGYIGNKQYTEPLRTIDIKELIAEFTKGAHKLEDYKSVTVKTYFPTMQVNTDSRQFTLIYIIATTGGSDNSIYSISETLDISQSDKLAHNVYAWMKLIPNGGIIVPIAGKPMQSPTNAFNLVGASWSRMEYTGVKPDNPVQGLGKFIMYPNAGVFPAKSQVYVWGVLK